MTHCSTFHYIIRMKSEKNMPEQKKAKEKKKYNRQKGKEEEREWDQETCQ